MKFKDSGEFIFEYLDSEKLNYPRNNNNEVINQCNNIKKSKILRIKGKKYSI